MANDIIAYEYDAETKIQTSITNEMLSGSKFSEDLQIIHPELPEEEALNDWLLKNDNNEIKNSDLINIPPIEDLLAERGMPFSTVIGTDDRALVRNYTEKPFNWIYYIQSKFGGENYRGTCFALGPRLIGTCGHNLYDISRKSWSEGLIIYYRKSNGSWGTLPAAKTYIISCKYRDGFSGDDWGLIVLKDKQSFGNFGIVQTCWYPTYKDAEVTGYPAEVRNKSTSDLYTEGGALDSLSGDYAHYHYKIDTSGGNSGSPVRVLDWNHGGKIYPKSYATGIHFAGNSAYNTGRGIDNMLYEVIKEYKDK